MNRKGNRWRKPELLAPAGSFEALRAAVGAGADAVYLGGRRFGARAYAQNFDDGELVEALDYAHRADVRVYVTVNTLLTDAELPEAARFLLFLYERGVDGVLVQDLGLIGFARTMIPGLSLHGSTQMTLHNHGGVQWAAKLGLERVVLARELGISEIRQIAMDQRGYSIGLEIFVHGALCYSYSGQCLLSSAIGGRSGNRGRCAQPCRKPYLFVQGPVDEYDRLIRPQSLSTPSYCLSTRDLSTYRHLRELLRLPIEAMKIEGRMKSPEYVATVVRIYRAAIDGIADGTWSPRPEDEQDLLLAFNRGFTAGHLLGEPVMGASRPDHQGVFLGTVVGYDGATQTITIRWTGNTIPEKGDGVQFIDDTGKEYGLRINRPPVHSGPFLYLHGPVSISPGAQVFLTGRASLARAAEKVMKRSFFRPIPVDVEISWDGQRAIFQGVLHPRDRDLSFRYESPLGWEEARTQPLSEGQILQQLRKSGGTPFMLTVRLKEYPGGLFLPLSGLNTLRRDLVGYLESLLVMSHLPSPEAVSEARTRLTSYRPGRNPSSRIEDCELFVCVHSQDGAVAAMEGGADSIGLQAPVDEVIPVLRLCRERGIPLIWIWPRIILEKELEDWLTSLSFVESHGLTGVMVSGAGFARAVQDRHPHIRRWGSPDLNVWNHCTVQMLAPYFHALIVSTESSLTMIRDLSGRLLKGSPSLGCLVQGNLEVMVSENCLENGIPYLEGGSQGLRDSRDRIFPVTQDAEGRTHIYNAVETCYIDHLPALREAGISSFVIEARNRSPRYVREITSLYREALRRSEQGDDVGDLKEEVRKRSRGGLTLGPLRKGLKEET